MEKEMSALKRLQDKIEQWKTKHEALKTENAQLKDALSSTSSSEHIITNLKAELAERDAEIEKIIEQVEALLS